MLNFHPVDIERELNRFHPLYVGNFFSLNGMWWRKRKLRQGLIISIAVAWYQLMRNPNAAGFIEKEIFITNLTRQVRDARKILDHFFSVTRIGFNFGNGSKSPSVVTPKRLNNKMFVAIESILDELRFTPGAIPTDKNFVKSDVHVQKNVGAEVIVRLKKEGRENLIPAVRWILKQESPIQFYFRASGALQARDTSVWPIRAIETWPGWLRLALFGVSIDIESAYLQFIVYHLKKKYEKNPHLLQLKYPDLLRANNDKKNFRLEILELLQLENNYDNMKSVKKLIMSLANGSNASPVLMTNGSAQSQAVHIVRAACPGLRSTDLLKVGKRLSTIVKQFKAARRDMCIYLLKSRPTRKNQNKIFKLYFEWERESRHKIWSAVGKTGLHLHDAIDGAVSGMTDQQLVEHLAKATQLRVSIKSPMREAT